MPVRLEQYEAVLLDLDGTVYHEDHPLPGAVELVRRLRQSGMKYACLTNGVDSPSQIARRLARMGAKVDAGHIYSVAVAAAEYVVKRFGEGASIYNLASTGFAEMVKGKVRWVRTAEEPCDAVVSGNPLCAYAKFERQRTALALLRRGAALVGLCADRVFPSPRGMEFGTGAMCAMLGYAADVRPVFCGKPEKVFFQELCERIGVRPGRCVLIGDNLESDVMGAKRVGMRTILTLTGVTRREDLRRLPRERRPDAVVGSLFELPMARR